jgi:hypothetical protein
VGSDIPEFFALVEKHFTPEEAEINNALPSKPATVEEIVSRTYKDENVVNSFSSVF